MNNKILLSLFLFNLILLIHNTALAQCTGCTHNINGNSNSNVTVNGTRIYCFNSGTFTGSINGPQGSAIICIGPNATFNPSNMNNWNGVIYNYGTANINTTSMGGNAELHNYGDLTINGLNLNGSHNDIINYEDGILIIRSNLSIPRNGSLTNDGEVYIQNDFSPSGIFTNKGKTIVGGNYNASGPSNNSGTFRVNGTVNMGSNADFNNVCISIFGNGISASTSKFKNEGFIWVTSGSFQNSGTYHQTSGAQLRGKDFANSGSITGAGNYYFVGNTANSAWIGQDAQGLNFYDATRSNQNLFFDQQSVAPHNSVTKNIFTPADSLSWGGGGNADAGTDQAICETSTKLNATGNSGTWQLVAGNAQIADINNPKTTVSSLSIGDNTFKWIVDATCGVATDFVTVTRNNEFPETTWTGAENNNWHNNNNWTHCIPGPNTLAIIRNAGYNPMIQQNQKAVAKKVEMLPGADLEISTGASLYVNEE